MTTSAQVVLFAAFSLGIYGGTARAAEDRVPPEIRACEPIRSNSERLACFDRAVSYLTLGRPDAVATPAPSAQDMFGMKASTPAHKAERKVDRTQVEGITAKVTALKIGSDGLILDLDNGQTWHQISAKGTLLLKTGDEVKITRGALNSFNLTTPSGRIAKVKRVR